MMLAINEIHEGDCLELMKEIPEGSVDMVLCDLPYGTTQNKWDSVIPMKSLWELYNRKCKLNGAMVFTAAEPFMSVLVMSNIYSFRYDLIWHKSQAVGHLNARRMPMRSHENIAVFYRNTAVYNPQIMDKLAKNIRPVGRRGATDNYGKFGEYAERTIPKEKRYPQSVETFNNPNRGDGYYHPTQKPVALFEYLIRTYTNEGDIVLDNCSGSGTSAIAAINTKRNYICIEKEPKYVELSRERVADHLAKMSEQLL